MAVSVTKEKLVKSALALSVLFSLSASQSWAVPAKAHPKSLPVPPAVKGEIVVKLQPSAVTREGKIVFNKDFFAHPNFTRPIEHMNQGKMSVDGEDVVLYIPKHGPYSLTTDPEEFGNTSMRISVDTNNDGRLENTESWFSSIPVRIANSMFQVRSVDPGGTWIKFAKLDAPLTGLVVGKPCPDFEFTTADGKKVRLEDYKGKTLLLDVWSMG